MPFLVQDGFHWPGNSSPTANGSSWVSPWSWKRMPHFFPHKSLTLPSSNFTSSLSILRSEHNRHVYVQGVRKWLGVAWTDISSDRVHHKGDNAKTLQQALTLVRWGRQTQQGEQIYGQSLGWHFIYLFFTSLPECIYQLIDKDVLLKEHVSHPPSAPSAPSAFLLHKWMTNPGQIYLSSSLSSFIKCLSPRRWLTTYDLRVEEGGGPGQLGTLQIFLFPS